MPKFIKLQKDGLPIIINTELIEAVTVDCSRDTDPLGAILYTEKVSNVSVDSSVEAIFTLLRNRGLA